MMTKAQIFGQIVLRSLRLGVKVGALLSFVVGLLFTMFSPGALVIALLVGLAAGASLGILNGLFIGLVTCVWFVPLRNARLYYHILGWCCALGNVIGLLFTNFYALSIFAGPAAWWASLNVADWYLAQSERVTAGK